MITSLHPLVSRFAAARNMFLPEISNEEIGQMNDIAMHDTELPELELNRKLAAEFGLEVRHQARIKSENDIDEMVSDFKEVIVKWGMLKMVDPLVVAGSVISHLEGMSAVVGCYIEDMMALGEARQAAAAESAAEQAVPADEETA